MLESSPEGCTGTFAPAKPSDGRSPCPALNALANHGYIARDGRDIRFTTLVAVLTQVYNIALPLAILLACIGYITCGKLSISRSRFDSRKRSSLLGSLFQTVTFPFRLRLQWTLNLCALQKRAFYCITHDASLVHCDRKPTCAPDRTLVSRLVEYSLNAHRLDPGLSLSDFARFRGQRMYEAALCGRRLSKFHEQVSLGECALAWLVLKTRCPSASPTTSCVSSLHIPPTRTRGLAFLTAGDTKGKNEDSSTDAVVPLSRILQLFGEERLPDGWWDDPAKGGVRPPSTISFSQARTFAKYVGRLGRLGM